MDEMVAALIAKNESLAERVRQLEELLVAEWHPPVEWGLTPTESRLVGALMKRELATKSYLMSVLYSDRMEEPEEKIVDVLVCKIRRKLQLHGVAIETVWGQGYRLKDRENRA
ncbi:helix-turn-helix domain-containing protein [Shinella pollutisoli]|uniref:Helix-turn-helix domain-containing protein n=1 Tax=Shinella pollutisoli TaxID=2250594 RepID=A0ABV7DIE3_9HYPH|nr:helix-turn-helix domain-containing protein [Shinella pollutisoli]